MAQYQKIDGECSTHTSSSKASFYNKEEHLEIDLYQRESDLRHRHLTCIKNPGHEQFVEVKDLTLEDFPESLRDQSVFDYVMAFSKLVVRIKVRHTSQSRPKDDPFQSFMGRAVLRGATGVVCKEVDAINVQSFPCTNGDCILFGTDHSVYGFIDVQTNRHVVYDSKEAKNSEVEFFYDDADRLRVVTLKGHDVRRDNRDEESVVLQCVTHDLDFIKKMHRLVDEAMTLGSAIPRSLKDCSMTDFAIIVSHPHGSVKKFSIGALMEYRKIPDKAGILKRFLRQVSGKQNLRMRVTTYMTATCPGSTGAPVVTGYDDGWGWWAMGHSTADLNSGIHMAFTS